MPLETSPLDLLHAAARHASEGTHTAIPAKVLSYNPTSQTVKVQFCVKNPYTDEDGAVAWEELPVLDNVPVLFPRGGGFFITVPLVVGDFVWVMFSELATGQWRETGTVPSEAVETKRHGLGHAWAMPGPFPSADPLSGPSASELRMGKEGGVQVNIGASEIRLGSGTPSDFVALASAVATELAQIAIKFLACEPAAVPGSGPVYTPGSVAATEVKAK